MTIEPEVVPPSSSAGLKAVRFIPKWAIFSLLGVGVLIVVSLLKVILPLLLMSLLLGFIWKQASK